MDEALYDEMYRVESEHWWFQAKHRIVRSLLDRYVKRSLAPDTQRPRIADLGCGCGMMISKLMDRYDAVGLDASEQAAQLAARRGISIRVGNLPGPTNLPGSHYDAVLLLDVLEHLDDDSGTVTEAIRLVKDGGLLIATVPAHQWLWTKRDQMHHHRRRYSYRQFQQLMDRRELECIATTYINSLLFPLAFVERLYRKIRPLGDTGDLKIPPSALNALFRETFAFERHFVGRCPLPMGLSLLSVRRKRY